MSLVNHCLFVIVVLSAISFIDSINPGCKDENSVCKSLRSCDHTLEISRKKGHYSSEYQNYLRINFCGFYGYELKVCCPEVFVSPLPIVKKVNPTVSSKPATTHSKSTSKPTKTTTTTTSSLNWLNLKNDPSKNTPEIDIFEEEDSHSLLPKKCKVKHRKRMIGGVTVLLNEFPWMAVLEYEKNSKNFGCSGSLISKRYVLTAGHCVSSIPENRKLKHVRLGEHNIDTNPDCEPVGDRDMRCADPVLVVTIEQEILHDMFWKPNDYANDIALLRLSRNVPSTYYIQPICMAKSSDLGVAYWTAGWGQTEFKTQSPTKLKVHMPLFDFDECSRLYATTGITLGPGQMCAGGLQGKDACAGDSGGPLMRLAGDTWTLDGIVSMGHRPCGYRGWPGVYTKVFHYLPWILSKLKP